jgi:hypothetical protein
MLHQVCHFDRCLIYISPETVLQKGNFPASGGTRNPFVQQVCNVYTLTLIALMMEAARTSETSVDNYFTQQYIPEDKSESIYCPRYLC